MEKKGVLGDYEMINSIWMEGRSKKSAVVLTVDIQTLACCCGYSLKGSLQSWIVSYWVSLISYPFCAIWHKDRIPKGKCSFSLPSLQAEFPWVCINSELKVGRYNFRHWDHPAHPHCCKPKYCFDISSFKKKILFCSQRPYSFIIQHMVNFAKY